MKPDCPTFRCPHCERPVEPGDPSGRRGRIAGTRRVVARYRCECGYRWFLTRALDSNSLMPGWDWPRAYGGHGGSRKGGGPLTGAPPPDEVAARADLCRQARTLLPCLVINRDGMYVQKPRVTYRWADFETGLETRKHSPGVERRLGRLALERPKALPAGSR